VKCVQLIEPQFPGDWMARKRLFYMWVVAIVTAPFDSDIGSLQ